MTYSEFVAGLANISVEGVKKVLSSPPTSLESGDLPTMWIGLPSGDSSPITFRANGGWPTLTCDIIIAVEPAGQDIQINNYDKTITILDNLSNALRSSDIGRSALRWSISTNVTINVSGVAYWAVIATVSGR